MRRLAAVVLCVLLPGCAIAWTNMLDYVLYNTNTFELDMGAASNDFVWATNGTDMVHLKSQYDKVGIGTDDPQAVIHASNNTEEILIRLDYEDDGTGKGRLNRHKVTASPADNEWINIDQYIGPDSAGAYDWYGYQGFRMDDVTAGSTDGSFYLVCKVNSTANEHVLKYDNRHTQINGQNLTTFAVGDVNGNDNELHVGQHGVSCGGANAYSTADLTIIDAASVLVFIRNDSSIVAGNTVGQIRMMGLDGGSLSAPQEGVRLNAAATETWSTGNAGASFNIYTTPNGSATPVLNVTVDQSGYLGVLTNAPSRALHVNDTMRLEPRSSFPASPAAGDLVYHSTSNKLYCHDGTIWNKCW